MVTFFTFFVFQHNPYLKKMSIFSEKMKIFEYSSIFQSFCVKQNKFKGYIWVAIHIVFKTQFSAFLSYLPLFISQQSCRKFSENREFFSVFSQVFLLWSFNKSDLSVLIRLLFVMFSWFHSFPLIIRHNRYILNIAKFLHFCWILLI